MKKSYVFLVILLLIFTSFPQLSARTNSKIESSDTHEESGKLNIKDADKGDWKTNYFCRINVYVDGYCYCDPELGLFFVRNAEITGNIIRCSISGKNGNDIFESGYLDLRVKYLFGFCRYYFQSWLSWADMRGFAIKCEYKVT
jgi:hypothetical protein